MAMSTLALLVIAHSIFNNWSGMTRGSEGVYGLPQNTNLWKAAAFAAACVVLAIAFKQSRIGLQVRSSREDALAAGAAGVNVVRVRYVAWVLSAAVSGMGGSIWAQYNLGFASPQFYYAQVFALLAMLVVGGMSNVSGAVIGAGAVTLVSEVLRRVENEGSLFGLQVPRISGLAQMVVAVVILLILIYRPSGILGWRELDDWVHRWLTRRRLKRAAQRSSPQLSEDG